MYQLLARIILCNIIFLSVQTNAFADLSGPCAKECTIRGSIGNQLLKGKPNELTTPGDIFVKNTNKNGKSCMDGCTNETSAKGCKACAKRVITDQVLSQQKSQLATYACPSPNPQNVACTAMQQPKYDDYQTFSKAEQEAQKKDQENKKKERAKAEEKDIEKFKRDYARAEADKYEKKAADLLAKSQEMYIAADSQPPNVQLFSFPAAQKVLQDAVGNKVHAVRMRDYADGKPFNPGKTFCFQVCNSQLPINGMSVTGAYGLYDRAKFMIAQLATKAILECVIGCAGNSDGECSACAQKQVSPDIMNYINSNFGCGVTAEGPPPTTGQVVGQTILDVIGISGAGPSCPKISFPGVTMIIPPYDPAKMIQVNRGK